MTREPLDPFTGDLDELIAYARQLLAHKLVPLKQEAFRDLVAVAEECQRLLAAGSVAVDDTVLDRPLEVYGALTSGRTETTQRGLVAAVLDRLAASPNGKVLICAAGDTVPQLLADAEIVLLRGGPDRIAFLKEQP